MYGFFGRAAELASLRDDATESLLDGQVTVRLVEGAPGIGKSRLLAQFVAQLPGTSTVSVACYQPEARLPLSLAWTLSDALRPSDLGSARSREVDPSGGWAALAEALHREVSLRAPAVIVVDDVQWCDEGSVGVLHYLVRGAVAQEVPLVLVLAARPSPTVAALSDALERLPAVRFARVPLGALEQATALALIKSLDPTLDEQEVADLAARADGSPFWCRHLATAGSRRQPADHILIGRLRSMSADATAVLATCVVLARPLELREVAEIHCWPDERCRAALDELTVAGSLIEENARVRFSHDLVRAAVEDQLPVPLRIHELVVTWMEAQGGDVVIQLLAAARLRRSAGLPTGLVLHRILSSPRRRMVGIDGLQTISELADEIPPDDPSAVALAQGVAVLAGELGRHSLSIERWLRVARSAEDSAGRARAWLAASEEAQHLERVQEARSYLRAARRTAPDDALLTVELDAAEAGLTRWLEHDPDRARELTQRALGNARTLMAATGAPAVRDTYLRTLVLACVEAMQRNAADEILPLAAEITEAAVGADTRASVQARLRSGSALMLVGRLDAAERELSSAWNDARRAFLTDLVLDVGSWLTWTRYLKGQLPEAEEAATECAALATRLDERTRPASMVQQWRHIIQISRGDHLGAFNALRDMVAAEADAHHRIALRQAIATWLGRLAPDGSCDEVLAQLDEARSDAEIARCSRCRTELLLTGAEALARIRARDQAEAWLGEGRSCTDGGTLQGWLTARAEASLASAFSEDLDRVVPALERATTLADEIGLTLEAIWTRLDLGQNLIGQDANLAAEVLREAAVRGQSSGAVTETRLAARLLRQSGRRTWQRSFDPQAPPGLDELSPREREIAGLISQGASNPQIAQTLFLSRKTIERHVSNIFLKTGVKNRTQLAARYGAQIDGPPG